ncbi:unnamed protein product [Dibothriocephalus latus]|uniref:Uncharacterized protein n=1 Tax=Dibothriocephalus latus TaxID=60516 RepID=A0A3P6TRB1_DIBLA|nr:unnamed protein product [Dibothriocephalus latus]
MCSAANRPINAGTVSVSEVKPNLVMAATSIAYQLTLLLLASLLVASSTSAKPYGDLPRAIEAEEADLEQADSDASYEELLEYLLSRAHAKRGFLTASRLGKRGFLTASRLGKRGMFIGSRLG